MVEAPKVYCPREGEEVPIWWCLGSSAQRRKPCKEQIKTIEVITEDYADVRCVSRNFVLLKMGR